MPNKIEFNKEFPSIKKSDELYQKALNLIPCTTQTLAKGPQQNVKGIAPKYLVKGKGSHVWDADGNEYLDFNMAIGPLSLGYAYDKVDEAIKKQLEDGITFSLMHPLEVEVAEMQIRCRRYFCGDKSCKSIYKKRKSFMLRLSRLARLVYFCNR
jgi:glutamate-1-semialdehyde 2,1-aminomutase